MSQSGIFRFLPIAEWLPDCTSKILRIDIIAGLAVAGLLIPQGMAYAGIAGVPPQVGLYAAMAGMLVYAVFKTSRQLAVTPTSSSAAMLAALVARMAVGDSARYAPLASFIFLAGGIFKLGSVSEFISKPVLKGFVFGLGLTMARVSDGVRDLLTRSGFLERLGNDRILSGVDIAVDAFLKASPPSTEQPISFAQTHA